MGVIVTDQGFDPWQELQAYQHAAAPLCGQVGATSIFIGTMRDFNDGNGVQAMTLEHYPGMTEKQLVAIVAEAGRQWQVLDALVIHRVGELLPNDPIVLVAVWTTHRGDAFDACRYIMEALKSRAPFWKKERLLSADSRWVQSNTDGYHAADKPARL